MISPLEFNSLIFVVCIVRFIFIVVSSFVVSSFLFDDKMFVKVSFISITSEKPGGNVDNPLWLECNHTSYRSSYIKSQIHSYRISQFPEYPTHIFSDLKL